MELLMIYGIKLFLVSWVLSSWAVGFTESITIKPFKNESKTLLETFGRLIYSLGLYVMSCPKCFTFWFVLILTLNPFWAAGISFVMMWVDKLSQNIKTRL